MNTRFSLVALALIGCGSEVNVTKVDSEIGVSTELIDFGDVAVGATTSQPLELWVVEGAEAELYGVTYPDDDVDAFDWSGEGGTIPLGGALAFDLYFTPPTPGQFISQVVLQTSDESTNGRLIYVRGRAVEGRAERWPSVLDLGAVGVGQSGTGNVSVRNTGGVPIVLSELPIEPGDCTVSTEIPLTVEVGATETITVSCTAVTEDAFTGSLAFDAGGVVTLEPVLLRMNDCESGDAGTYDLDGDGYAACADDCDDSNPDARPGGVESCDGVDNDCDGTVDEGTPCYDDDGDGFTEEDGDCNDGDVAVSPGAEEVQGNGVDDDCDGVVDQGSDDGDADGYTVDAGDCDDADATVWPGAPELADGLDNDCDGTVDEGTTAYDDDGDGYTEDGGDCDDTSASIFPGAPELADWADNDCDGTVDEGTSHYDDDGDGYTEDGGDCDDADPAVGPGELEVVGNGIDDDCDGTVE